MGTGAMTTQPPRLRQSQVRSPTSGGGRGGGGVGWVGGGHGQWERHNMAYNLFYISATLKQKVLVDVFVFS